MMLQAIFSPKTQKEKLFSGFFLYTVLSFLMAVVGFTCFLRMERLDKAVLQVNELHMLAMRTATQGQEFLLYEADEARFLQQGRSHMLEKHQRNVRALLSRLSQMRQDPGAWKEGISAELDTLDNLLLAYDDTYRRLVRNLAYRGGDAAGLEGYLRQLADSLGSRRVLSSVSYLSLRLAEKEYLLRPRQHTLQRLQQELLKVEMALRAGTPADRSCLASYRRTLSKLASVHVHMGMRTKTGLSGKMLVQGQQMALLVERINKEAKERKEDLYRYLQAGVLIVVSCSVLLLAVLAASFSLVVAQEESARQMH